NNTSLIHGFINYTSSFSYNDEKVTATYAFELNKSTLDVSEFATFSEVVGKINEGIERIVFVKK
ncbi:MAG: hypothetical protein ACHQFW_10655, partial [Chitinophagales bacterium]